MAVALEVPSPRMPAPAVGLDAEPGPGYAVDAHNPLIADPDRVLATGWGSRPAEERDERVFQRALGGRRLASAVLDEVTQHRGAAPPVGSHRVERPS